MNFELQKLKNIYRAAIVSKDGETIFAYVKVSLVRDLAYSFRLDENDVAVLLMNIEFKRKIAPDYRPGKLIFVENEKFKKGLKKRLDEKNIAEIINEISTMKYYQVYRYFKP